MGLPFKEGEIVEGKITSLKPYGAFISLAQGVQGLVHISEIRNEYIQNIHDYLKIGEIVTAKILKINPKDQKIALSLRALEWGLPQQGKGNLESISKNRDQGFYSLKRKLNEWILRAEEQSHLFS